MHAFKVFDSLITTNMPLLFISSLAVSSKINRRSKWYMKNNSKNETGTKWCGGTAAGRDFKKLSREIMFCPCGQRHHNSTYFLCLGFFRFCLFMITRTSVTEKRIQSVCFDSIYLTYLLIDIQLCICPTFYAVMEKKNSIQENYILESTSGFMPIELYLTFDETIIRHIK